MKKKKFLLECEILIMIILCTFLAGYLIGKNKPKRVIFTYKTEIELLPAPTYFTKENLTFL